MGMGLRDSIYKDTVADLAIRDLIKVKPSASVRQVVAKMKKKRLGCAILVDDTGRPVGKFTERRLTRLLLEDPRNLDEPVEKFSYSKVDTVGRKDPIARIVQVMQERKLRYLCVVDEQGKAVGLTGQKGLVEYIADHFPRQVKVQRLRPVLYMEEPEGA
jgi:predicted transcriptional regulator